MFRKLIGACVGLAMMGMAGTANALLIVVGGELQGLDSQIKCNTSVDE